MNSHAIFQRTLKQPVSFVGLGLHSGLRSRITLKPTDDATGIFFKRKDVPTDQSLIAARWYRVTDTNLSTGLTNRHNISVSTIEHLMVALKLCRIVNLEIEVDSPEIPILDGSAKPFVDTITAIGTRPINEIQKAIWIHKPIMVRKGVRYALFLPDTQSRVTVSIDFKEPAIGSQTLSINTDDKTLLQEIAPARTFGFLNQIKSLRDKGLARGGSLNNAILVDGDRMLIPTSSVLKTNLSVTKFWTPLEICH